MLIEEKRGEGGDAMNEAMEEIGDQEDKQRQIGDNTNE